MSTCKIVVEREGSPTKSLLCRASMMVSVVLVWLADRNANSFSISVFWLSFWSCGG